MALKVSLDPKGLDELRQAAALIAELPETVVKIARATVHDTVDDLHTRAQIEMQRKFDRPTPYMMRGVKKLKSGTPTTTNQDMRRAGQGVFTRPGPRRSVIPGAVPRRTIGEAGIYFEEFGGGSSPADVIEPHIKGGGRNRKRFEKRLRGYGIRPDAYAVPTSALRKDQYGNVSGATISQMMFELNTFDSARRPAAGKPKKTRARRATREYFLYYGRGAARPIGIAERIGKRKIRVVMRFTQKTNYRRRYNFYEFSQRQANASLPKHFERVFRKYAQRLGAL